MTTKVCKFGGTSLATRERIEKALDIMLEDDSRRYMVVSAPGARYDGDIKVTDLLIEAAKEYRQSKKSRSAETVIERFQDIFPDSHIIGILNKELQWRLTHEGTSDYDDSLKAFGEYASAVVIDQILRQRKVDSFYADPRRIGFTISGKGKRARPTQASYREMGSFDWSQRVAVIPGFYGYNKKGNLVTLPRGGSDISGAAVARAVNADIYENWTTETDGLKRADPKIVENAETIPEMTYDEARELAYMGFKLQDTCFEPIKGRNIVLNVRNTDNPSHSGTRIVDSRQVDAEERIVGVACEKGFVSVGMRRMYIDQVVGFGRKMMQVLEKMKLPYEHTLDGVDTVSLVIAEKYFKEDTLDRLVRGLKRACKPEKVMIADMAILSAAGLGMKNHYDVLSKAFSALTKKHIAVRMIDEGTDDLSFFIGVDNEKADDAVRAIYNEFYPRKS